MNRNHRIDWQTYCGNQISPADAIAQAKSEGQTFREYAEDHVNATFLYDAYDPEKDNIEPDQTQAEVAELIVEMMIREMEDAHAAR